MSGAASHSDHFSGVAPGYAEFRPLYPRELFDALATLAPATGTVWDCAAGTGQATVALGQRFNCVLGTDISAQQIAQATPHANAQYAVALADACPLASSSVSLVTVAQALHWFDVAKFYAEARRVLKPNGLLCVWSYGLLRVDGNPRLEQLVDHFSERTLGAWWPAERRHVDAGYRDLPFPFERVPVGPLDMSATWSVDQLLGYLRTWSSVSRKKQADGADPVTTVEPELRAAWGAEPRLRLRWPLVMLAGR